MRNAAVRFGALGLLLAMCSRAAGENAQLPYHYLYRIEKLQAELSQAHTNLQINLQLQSTLPGVQSTNIEVYLDRKSGKAPIHLGPEGDIAVPVREDLLAEDPWLITNQPKGTMQLNCQAGLSRSFVRQITNSIHYAPIMRAARDCEDVQAKLREYFPGWPKLMAAALKLTFAPENKPAAVIIRGKSGERKLEADAAGEVLLPLDPDLLEEDPVLKLSAPLVKVQVLYRKVGD